MLSGINNSNLRGRLETLEAGTFSNAISAPRFLAAADSNTAPGFSWQSDTNTGIYSEAADTVSVTAGGARYLRVRSVSAEVLNAPLAAGNQILSSSVHTATSLSASPAGAYTPSGTGAAYSAANAVVQAATNNVALAGLSGGSDGREIWFINSSASNTITLNHEDASATAATRFVGPGAANVVLAAGNMVMLRYDAAASRWRVLA